MTRRASPRSSVRSDATDEPYSLTVREACARTGIGRTTMYELVRAGEATDIADGGEQSDGHRHAHARDRHEEPRVALK